MRRFAPILALFAAPAACVGALHGEFGAEEPAPMRSGFWFQESAGEAGVITAHLYSFAGSCDAATAWLQGYAEALQTAEGEAELAEALTELDATVLPDDYWYLVFRFTADRDGELDGVRSAAADPAAPGAGEFSLIACHHHQPVDWAAVLSGAGSTEDECWRALSGEVSVLAFDPEGWLEWSGHATLEDPDGQDAESVSFSFAVPGCDAWQQTWDRLHE